MFIFYYCNCNSIFEFGFVSIIMNSDYYVYVILNPLKPSSYRYDAIDLVFEYEPFYIGKGRGDRWKRHIWKTPAHHKVGTKIQMMKKFKELRFFLPEELKNIRCHMLNIDALVLETKIINVIGQICSGAGPLVNILSYGGKSSSEDLSILRSEQQRKSWTEERKIKHSMFMKQLYHSEDDRFRKAFQSTRPDYKSNGIKISQARKLKFKTGLLSLAGEKNTNSKTWVFIDPTGKEYTITGTSELFCREHGLPVWTMREIAKCSGKYKSDNWNQWTCRFLCSK